MDDYDSYEDYEEAQEMKEQKARLPQTKGGKAPSPIIYHDAITSFTEQYEPREWWSGIDVIFFTLGDLRQMFAGIVPFGVPDAMPAILEFLRSQGFVVQNVPGFSEPVMAVVNRDNEDDDRYLSL